MAQSLFRFPLQRFLGVDNKNAAETILPDEDGSVFLSGGSNVDIDNKGRLHRRDGDTLRYTGSDIHSLWGAENQTLCLFVDGTNLKSLSTTYTASAALLSGLNPKAPMRYVEVDDTVYYTNNTVIGYYKGGVCYSFPEPGLDYKKIIPAGQEIEYYNGCLYVARGNMIWVSDTMNRGMVDMRHGFIDTGGYITLMKAAKDGLYVGNGSTYWLQGGGRSEFVRHRVADYDAVPGTAFKVDGNKVGDGSAATRIVFWLSDQGICMGGDGGQFRNLTLSHYTPTAVDRGTGIFRSLTDPAIDQFIAIGSS